MLSKRTIEKIGIDKEKNSEYNSELEGRENKEKGH